MKVEDVRSFIFGPRLREIVKTIRMPTISTLIAVAALGLSMITAYFTNIRVVDELRVFAAVAAPASPSVDNQFSLPGNWDITFINSGARAVAIRGVEMWVGDDTLGRDGSNNFCFGPAFDTNLAPFVLKEKEIVQKKVTAVKGPFFKGGAPRSPLEGLLGREDNGEIGFRTDLQEPKSAYKGDICLAFYFFTFSKGSIYNLADVGKYEYHPFDATKGLFVSSSQHRPFLILHDITYIWHSD